MFKKDKVFEKFEKRVWLSSPTMHGDELEYMKEAYTSNWMSTVGENINEVEKKFVIIQVQNMQSHCRQEPQHFIWQ